MSFAIPARSLRKYAPIWRFSSTVRFAKTIRPSGTCANPSFTISCGGSFVMLRPS